ncbi:HD domain-containing phosphohydrolase [Thermogutta sp.]|uniref:HD domain-containing phosphohydrolase n=2 Tax=Thermogutta sp. TaxID=1962930 RepID=UPI0032204178
MNFLRSVLLENRKRRILLLDDEPAVVRSLARVITQFRSDWEVEAATDPEEAWRRLQRERFDVLVTDVRMPKVTGLTLLERMQMDPRTACIPVVVVTGWGDHEIKLRALELGAIDLLEKPVEPRYLVARLQQVLRWKEGQDILAALNVRLRRILDRHLRELTSARMETIFRLLMVIQHRNVDLAQHSVRVAVYSKVLAQLLKLEEGECHEIFWAGMLHDVGKVALPDALLVRAGMFSPGETILWQKHCQYGEQILRGRAPWSSMLPTREDGDAGISSIVKTAAQVAISHHERWDGTGYPYGLEGEAIPLPGRIVAIADAFDHATHPLAWAQPSPLIVLPTSEVADRTFDPRVLEVFRSHEDVFRKLTDQLRRMLPSDERWPVNPDGQLFGEWESAAGLNSDKSGAECLLE